MKKTKKEKPEGINVKQKKKIGVWRVIVWICALTAIFCFGSYFLSTIISNAEGKMVFLSAFSVLAVAVPLFFEKLWKKLLPGKLFRFLAVCYSIAAVFFFVTFAVFVGFIASYSAAPPANEGKTVILVYGCRVKGDDPGVMLRGRLDRALELLCENPDAVCIVSGGVDHGAVLSEGEVMARYLEKNGISRDRITVEGEADSTKDNIRRSLVLIRENGWEDLPVISVSSNFHLPRIAYFCSRFGLASEYTGSPMTPQSATATVTREYLAYLFMFIS